MSNRKKKQSSKGIDALNSKIQAEAKNNEKKVELVNEKAFHIWEGGGSGVRKDSVMPTAAALQFFHEVTKNSNEEVQTVSSDGFTYADPQKDARYELRKAYVDENWDQWLYDLLNGHNLLFYGIGCKRKLLYDFINHNLSSELTVCVEGSNSLSTKYSSSAYLHHCEGESDDDDFDAESGGKGVVGAGFEAETAEKALDNSILVDAESDSDTEGMGASSLAQSGRSKGSSTGVSAVRQERERLYQQKVQHEESGRERSRKRKLAQLPRAGAQSQRRRQEQDEAERQEALFKDKYNVVSGSETLTQLLNTICEAYLELKTGSGSSYGELLCGQKHPSAEAFVGAIVAEIERLGVRDMEKRYDSSRDPLKWAWEQEALLAGKGRPRQAEAGSAVGGGSAAPVRDLGLLDLESRMVKSAERFHASSRESTSTAAIPQSRRQQQGGGLAIGRCGRYPTAPGLNFPMGQSWGSVRTHSLKKLLFIVIHNIDGDRLQLRDTQFALSLLAACPYVRLVVTCDHLNTPLLWEHNISSHFNWSYLHTPTFVPSTMNFEHYSLNRVKMRQKMSKKSQAVGAGLQSSMAKTSIESIWTGLSGPHSKILTMILEWYASGFKRIIGSTKLDLPSHEEIQKKIQIEMGDTVAETVSVGTVNGKSKAAIAKQQKEAEKARARTLLHAERLVTARIEKQKKAISEVQTSFDEFLQSGMPIQSASASGASAISNKSKISTTGVSEKGLYELCKDRLIQLNSIHDLKIRLNEFCDQGILDKAVLTHSNVSKSEYGRVKFLLKRPEIERYCKLAKVSLK